MRGEQARRPDGSCFGDRSEQAGDRSDPQRMALSANCLEMSPTLSLSSARGTFVFRLGRWTRL
jgi:hypothetical protein